jgi:adenine-specific DNA methylase
MLPIPAAQPSGDKARKHESDEPSHSDEVGTKRIRETLTCRGAKNQADPNAGTRTKHVDHQCAQRQR